MQQPGMMLLYNYQPNMMTSRILSKEPLQTYDSCKRITPNRFNEFPVEESRSPAPPPPPPAHALICHTCRFPDLEGYCCQRLNSSLAPLAFVKNHPLGDELHKTFTRTWTSVTTPASELQALLLEISSAAAQTTKPLRPKMQHAQDNASLSMALHQGHGLS